jgi:acyl carrier protein
MTTHERVLDIVANHLGVDKNKLSPETRFLEDLGCDSLDAVEIVMEIEEEFDISVPDELFDKAPSIGKVVELLQKEFGA